MIRKIFAVILVIIFIPLVIAVVLAWNAKITVLNPLFLISQLDRSGVYEKVEKLTPKYLVDQFQNQNELSGLKNFVLTPEIEQSFRQNFPKGWIQSNSEAIINKTLSYINGKSSDLDLKIDTTYIKNSLKNFLPIFLKPQIESLPVCQQGVTSNDQNLTCRPKDMTSDELAQKVTNEMFKDKNSFVFQIPDSYDFGNQLSNQSQYFSLAQIRQNIQNFNRGLYILTVLLILIFILIGFLIFRPFSSVLKWLGISLLVPGIALIPAAISRFFLANFIQSALARYPSDIAGTIQPLVSNILIGMLNNLLYVASGLIIVSILLFILALILRPRTKFNKQNHIQKSQESVPPKLEPQDPIEELKVPKLPIQKMPEPPRSIDTITSKTKNIKITPIPSSKQKSKSRRNKN